MRKFIVLLSLVALSVLISVAAFANDAIFVTIDGNYVWFDTEPQIISGRTMVPIRGIFEYMGATVEWEETTKTAICTKGETTVKMTVNSADMYVNDQVRKMDVVPCIVGSHILAPARFVAEAFGGEAFWNEPYNTVNIYTEKRNPLCGKIIVVDAGHGISSYKKKEPVAPNSSEKKAAFVSGTSGARQTEEQLNLAVAFKLKAILENKGATVYMTRTEHKCDMSNIDRAVFANNLNADISVKIHADGNDNKSVHGVSVLVPGNKYIKDNTLIEKSRRAGEYILNSFTQQTGAANRGIAVRNDLTGFNWSKVPVVLVELGFMSNPEEDRLMETEEYQNKMVDGIALGLEQYFEN